MKMVNITIDGINMQVPEGTTILEAAKQANIRIPTLCYLKGINEIGACRMCVVEVKAQDALQAACVYPVAEGLDIKTNSEKVRKARKITLELILSNHDRECLTCIRSNNCELQKLSKELNVRDIRFKGEHNTYDIDDVSRSIVRNNNKCILCRRCISACQEVQTVSVIETVNRGFKTKIGTAFDMPLAETPCVNCGQCINVCPVGALYEKSDTQKVWSAINDPEKYVIVQTAPAVRVSIGEAFGMPIGSRPTGKMVTALKRLGLTKYLILYCC